MQEAVRNSDFYLRLIKFCFNFRIILMNYRKDIDGLRAIAVIPVILFHAGIDIFKGGYIGVDIFFVISGYLITTIILSDLDNKKFSLLDFYEKRARRILPALFLVIFTCILFGYLLLMPDEFKNLGQSVVATILFSNNILLTITSGYWDLSSEFKPLLHTWSLGVEEQYYAIIPIILIAIWKIRKNHINHFLFFLFFSSLIFSIWSHDKYPNLSFYSIISRAWEICIGAIAAIYSRKINETTLNNWIKDSIYNIGFAIIILSFSIFNISSNKSPILLIIPTLGALFIIISPREKTFSYKILTNKIFVLIGLISYSLYLWHQPMFAYIRAFSNSPPNKYIFLFSIPIIFILSLGSYYIIERPCRSKKNLSTRSFLSLSFLLSLSLIFVGLNINNNYGIPSRISESSTFREDMDKRIYNERVFKYKKTEFTENRKTKILVIGNSFARDFINIIKENYNLSKFEIIYRDDLKQCITYHIENKVPYSSLFNDADIIVFSSGNLENNCYENDMQFSTKNNKKIFFVGSKDFGYNLNWLIQLSPEERKNKYNEINQKTIDNEEYMSSIINKDNFISLISPVLLGNKIPITDDLGRMLSTDRAHLTKFGAIYFGEKALKKTYFSEIITKYK